MQAIQTRYLAPTNTRGTRITARCQGGAVTVAYDYALNDAGNHKAAAAVLLEHMGWTRAQGEGFAGHWSCGSLPSGDMAWTFTPRQARRSLTNEIIAA